MSLRHAHLAYQHVKGKSLLVGKTNRIAHSLIESRSSIPPGKGGKRVWSAHLLGVHVLQVGCSLAPVALLEPIVGRMQVCLGCTSKGDSMSRCCHQQLEMKHREGCKTMRPWLREAKDSILLHKDLSAAWVRYPECFLKFLICLLLIFEERM